MTTLSDGGLNLIEVGNPYSNPIYINPNGNGLNLNDSLINQPTFSNLDNNDFFDFLNSSI